MIEDNFALARKLGIIRPGFRGTYTDICAALDDAEAARQEAEALRREEEYWESGGPSGERYAWEAEEDRRRAWL
jgi:hypothetical protein